MAAKTKPAILISHTHNEQNRELQTSDLRYHFHIRGGDIKEHDVQFLPNGNTTPKRRKAIQAWVDKNPEAHVYRNQVLTPCADIVTKKPVIKKPGVVKPETEKGGDA